MRLGVLGPLLVVDDQGHSVPVTSPRLRVVLAALLMHANSPVSTESLAELVWDGAPPDKASVSLRSDVRRLRAGLGSAWAQRIITRPPGYLCQAGEQEVDALWFEALCQQTDTAVRERRWAEASQTAELAASLWRGAPFLDVPCRILRDEFVPRLEQLRVQVLENQAEAALARGHHQQWAQPLRQLVAAHPLRERFHAQLMQALARCGRQAEALAAYQDARKVLVGELGIEPGPELRHLHERILAGDDDLVMLRPAAHPAPEGAPVAAALRQLPAATGHFTGRSGEVELITSLPGPAQPTDPAGGTVVISALDGMAGIGKTALAIHAAHRLAGKFPDGQLFIDLHGYTQGQPPRTAGGALDWLLRALGVPPERIPADGEQAAALYRQHLAGTRTLIVLDNAASEAQIRPLLPGAGSCLVLVTSRRRLKALDDAHALSLDLLSREDAVALLRAVAGPDRIPPEDPLAGEIAELCGYLPLALRIAASLLRHRVAWPLEHLAGQLRDQRQRVTALRDGERELAAVFDLSYTSLDEQHQRLWRRLGLIPGPDLDAAAAAALSDLDPVAAAGWLQDLVDDNLLAEYVPGRFRLHDLLRAHARALAAEDPAAEVEAALGRLLHYYARTAQSASVAISRNPRPLPDGPVPALPEPEAARTWLRTELPNLDAAFTHVHAHRLDQHTIALAAVLAEILQADGPFTRALEIHQIAAETAERLGRPAAHANALTDLGRVRRMYGDYPGADQAHTRALEIYRALGNRLGEANSLTDLGRLRYLIGDFRGTSEAHSQALPIYRALGNLLGEANSLDDLGRVRCMTGDYPGADHALTQALEIYRALGNRLGEANSLTDLGRVRGMTGDYPGAEAAQLRALEIYRALGNRLGEANSLTALGRVYSMTGDHPGAGDALTRALEIYRALGNRLGEANSLTALGRVYSMTGDYPGAGDALTRALEIYRTLGDRNDEAWALNYYGATLAAAGQHARALAVYQQALAMNRELNKPDDEAISLEGLAEQHLSTGAVRAGTDHLTQALEIFRSLGMAADAERVRVRLARLSPASEGDPAR